MKWFVSVTVNKICSPVASVNFSNFEGSYLKLVASAMRLGSGTTLGINKAMMPKRLLTDVKPHTSNPSRHFSKKDRIVPDCTSKYTSSTEWPWPNLDNTLTIVGLFGCLAPEVAYRLKHQFFALETRPLQRYEEETNHLGFVSRWFLTRNFPENNPRLQPRGFHSIWEI